MRRPGGEAGKVGNRYEICWTVKCLLEVLQEKADRIHLEPAGPDGSGIEFMLVRVDAEEHHQAKLGSSWTIRKLVTEGVLSSIQQKLRDPNARFVFVSDGRAEVLEDLATRAKGEPDLRVYLQHTLSQDLRGKLAQLCKVCVDWTEEEAFAVLKRVDVEHWPEKALRQHVESQLALLVDADPQTAYPIIANLVLDSVDVHKVLTAHDIWQHLEHQGIGPNQWHKDKSKAALVSEVTSRYVARLHGQTICGKIIPRPEAEDLLVRLRTPESKRALLVTGGAGGGKSGLLLQAVDLVDSEGWPVLAFRLDNLTSAVTPEEVGRQLGLPRSPAQVLAAIAQGRDCLLVIDQLDVVSFSYGRDTQLWDPINEIVTQALSYENMRVLLACRRFDLDNDHRLRNLIREPGVAEHFSLRLLDQDSVRQVLQSVGLEPDKMTTRQLALLSTPLHLKLLVDSVEGSAGGNPIFANETDLYDLFWDYKRKTVHNRLPSSRWTETVDALIEYMSGRQITSVPMDCLDEFAPEVDAMTSEHVLVKDAGRVSFFHDGFFDYAFARRFSARGSNLQELLLSGEQHLFRRSQVRQLLLYQREHHFEQYIENLTELLTSSKIRYHIKSIIYDLLADLPNPTEEEWEVLAQLLENTNASAAIGVWRVLQGKVPWFNLLDSLDVWLRWLGSDDEELLNRVIRLLWTVHKQVADRVAELVEPYVGVSEAWQARLRYLFDLGHLSAGRCFFDLFLRLIREGWLDDFEARSCDFWHMIYDLPDEEPKWACEAIGCYLKRRLELSLSAGCPNPFSDELATIKDSQIDDKLFEGCAVKAPNKLLEHVLPFVIRILELNAIREGDTPWHDEVWRYSFRGHRYRVEEHLLDAVETSLRSLAQSATEHFTTCLQMIRNTPYETLDFLFMQACSADPEAYANELIDYLCDRPARLDTCSLGGNNAVAADILRVITPHCSDERLLQLEDVLLGYYPSWERQRGRGSYRGSTQHRLLESCDYARLSDRARRRLAEWRRKFPDRTDRERPTGFTLQSVGSPIPEPAAAKMSDEQWLKAMSRYQEDRELADRNGQMVGGASELSQVLGECTKQEPERFAALVMKMPDDINSTYFDQILMGIADTDLSIDRVLAVCRRCHDLPGRPCGPSIHRLFSTRAEEQLPDEALDTVAWYATNDPDPVADRWHEKEDIRRQNGWDAILNEGISTVRGSAARAVAQLMFDHPERVRYLLPTLERMVRDPSTSVRACVVHALLPVLNYDRDTAVGLFLGLCNDAEDALLGTGYAEHFVNYALYTHFDQMSPLFDRMLSSKCPTAAVAGGRLACVAALVREEARPYLEKCLSGNPHGRKGAAEILARNVRLHESRSLCSDALSKLFFDSDADARRAAAICFGNVDAEEIDSHVALIRSFIKSPAFEEGSFYLIDKLHESNKRLLDLTCEVCECYLKMAGPNIADIRTARAANTDEVVELIIRTYSQTQDASIQHRCLNALDRILENGVRDTGKFLDLFDR